MPPDNFPDGNGKIFFAANGSKIGLCWHRYENYRIKQVEVIVDHDAGILSFRINNGAVIEALKGFPPGAALRPAVGLCAGPGGDPKNMDNRVSFVRGYL